MFKITDNMLNAGDLVDKILDQKKAHVLYAALMGDNDYIPEDEIPELDRHSIRLLTGALGHLKHLSRLEGHVINENHLTDFDHDYFKAWKLAGTPGAHRVHLLCILKA